MAKVKLVALIALSLFTLNNTFAQKKYVKLSMQLVEAAKNNQPYDDLLKQLESIPVDELAKNLDNDNARKAFWINVYNAHIQFFLKENPSVYEDRNKFFHKEQVVVAGRKLSFDKIEHGIIRGSVNKLSLGFIKKIRVDAYEKKFRIKGRRDGRIHFALNCGALSCPAVAIYDDTRMDEQLEKATNIHLNNTSTYDADKNEVTVTKLLSWFRGDFGNKKKVRKLLKTHDVIPKNAKPSLKYDFYDWTMKLDNYIDL